MFYSAILRLSDILTGWDIKTSLDLLNKSQWWSEADLAAYQNECFVYVLNYAYKCSPFYRELYDTYGIDVSTIKSLVDIKQLPIITKDDIVSVYMEEKMLCKGVAKGSYMLSQSSGSTGKRTKYYRSKKAYGFNMAANLRGWNWMGYRIGDRIVKESQNNRTSKLKLIQDRVNKMVIFNHSYSQEGVFKLYDLMKKIKPNFIRSHAEPMVFFIKKILGHGLQLPKLEGINTTGNILYEESRNYIENAFKCKIFDSYSCDGGPTVFECPTHTCYHIADESGIIEIINENGYEVKSGEVGRVIATTFHNKAFPLIRYDSMDLAERGDFCRCGRSLSTINKIIGRDNDIIVTTSGKFLIGQTFTTYMKRIPEIAAFQVHQITKKEVNIKIVLAKPVRDDFLRQLELYWNNYSNNELTFKVIVVPEIPLLPSGKTKFVIRDKSVKLSI